ncbi:MAG: hypothetical protein ILP11_01715 [Alphaproteobacteria bacterium]|nr:hypothetical protein [Alphaproteobacteria bacterium]
MRNFFHSLKIWVTTLLLPGLLLGCAAAKVETSATTDECVSCDLAVTIFDAINSLAENVMQNMCHIGLVLLGICYALWLLIAVSNGLLKGQRVDRDFFIIQVTMLAKVVGVGILLSNVDFLYYICQTIINPFLRVFFDFAAWIMRQGAETSGLATGHNLPANPARASNVLDPLLIASVRTVVFYIQIFIDTLRLWGARFYIEWPINAVVGWLGLFVILLSYTMSLAFSFLLLEPFFRLALFLVLMPVWAVAWCFSATQGMAIAAMKKIVVAAGQMFLTSIYFAILFIFIVAYTSYLDIPSLALSHPIMLAWSAQGNISAWLYFISFCLLYYFLQGMNTSIGYVLNEDLSSFIGHDFLKGLDGLIKQMINLIKLHVKLAKEALKIAAWTVATVATGGAMAVPAATKATIRATLAAIKTTVKTAARLVAMQTKRVIKSAFTATGRMLKKAAMSVGKTIQAMGRSVWNGVKRFATKAGIPKMAKKLVSAWRIAKQWTANGFNWVRSAPRKLFERLKNFNFLEWLKKLGRRRTPSPIKKSFVQRIRDFYRRKKASPPPPRPRPKTEEKKPKPKKKKPLWKRIADRWLKNTGWVDAQDNGTYSNMNAVRDTVNEEGEEQRSPSHHDYTKGGSSSESDEGS